MIVDHLSRLDKRMEDGRGNKIKEVFPDEQLFQVSVQTPRYADIMKFLACGIMPPEFSYQ